MRNLKACGLAAFAVLSSCSVSVLADENTALQVGHEYMVTTNYPNNLHVIDLATDTLFKTCKMPYASAARPSCTVAGRQHRLRAHQSLGMSGVELDNCKQVFHADFSSGDERVKAPFGMDVSPDGRELFVIQSPVRLGLGEYEVQPTRIAVYDTGSGVGAEPVRTFEVPRRIGMLMTSNDGSKLYALSWDLYVLDPQTGEEIGRHPLRTWQRENYGEPDVLDAWPQWDATDIFSSPYFVMRTDVDPGAAEAYKTGLVTLDLETGEFETKDFEDTAVIIFSTVVNPVRPNEVYGVYTTLVQDRPRGRQGARPHRARPHLLHGQCRLGRQRAVRRRHDGGHCGLRYRDVRAARPDRDAGRRRPGAREPAPDSALSGRGVPPRLRRPACPARAAAPRPSRRCRRGPCRAA